MMITKNASAVQDIATQNMGMVDAIWQRVDKIDLKEVGKKLMLDSSAQLTLEAVKQAESLYRRFLVLHALYPNEDFVPTKQIDEFWHQHILDTRNYAQDCEFLFGHFLHHDPYFGINGDDDRLRNEQAFAWTQAIWQSTFGEPLLGDANPCKSTDCR